MISYRVFGNPYEVGNFKTVYSSKNGWIFSKPKLITKLLMKKITLFLSLFILANANSPNPHRRHRPHPEVRDLRLASGNGIFKEKLNKT